MLPIKEAAATQVLSKGMRRAFTSITSVDLDDTLGCVCPHNPYIVKRSTLFGSFTDNLFQKLSESGKSLTRFRLHLGGDKTGHYHHLDNRDYCGETLACFSDLEPDRLSKWISYALSLNGLKELDVSFHVLNPSNRELPVGLFTCRSLEVLRLDCNLQIDGDKIPLICLPSLKLLHLCSFNFLDDEFVTRLVSSCPALDDLNIAYCLWEILDHVTISSHSLRTLVLKISKRDRSKEFCNLLLIDTPNLQYLEYDGYLANRYSIPHTNALVEASIYIHKRFDFDTSKAWFRSQLSLVREFSNVQRLSLLECCAENVCFSHELEEELPTFPNLRTLELELSFRSRWDIVLSLFLRRSPLLENLAFPEGLYGKDNRLRLWPQRREDRRAAKEEAEAWKTNQTIPTCFQSHLKRVEIGSYFGRPREQNMIKFCLSKASVLEELVITIHTELNSSDKRRVLKHVPRTSNSCSVTVK